MPLTHDGLRAYPYHQAVQPIGSIALRRQPGSIAVKFDEIEPDSLFHLQNIIRFNHPDTEKVEAEIEKHPGVK